VARADRLRLKLRAARWAGTAVRITRRPVRWVLLAAPGLAGAAAIAVGAGEVAGHVFGHGLALWAGLLVGGVFLVRIGAEVNAAPTEPRPPDD
jgi:hypothetical protein